MFPDHHYHSVLAVLDDFTALSVSYLSLSFLTLNRQDLNASCSGCLLEFFSAVF